MHKSSGSIVSSVGAVFTSLLSCAACPMCLPVYAGLLSLVGFELTELSVYFFPIMLGFLGWTLFLMTRQAIKLKTDIRPVALAAIAATAIVTSTWHGYETLIYACLVMFMGSVFWNKSILKRKAGCAEGGCCDGKSHSSHSH